MAENIDVKEGEASARGPGRPPAKRREKYPGRMIYVPDDLWSVALEQDGGASVFIRRLLREFRDAHRQQSEQTSGQKPEL